MLFSDNHRDRSTAALVRLCYTPSAERDQEDEEVNEMRDGTGRPGARTRRMRMRDCGIERKPTNWRRRLDQRYAGQTARYHRRVKRDR